MAVIINSNISSLNAQRQLLKSSIAMNMATERLSSGKKINNASDDAAGLTISNRMTSQVRGLNQAVRNSMDGVSLIQVAEGALDESSNILQRMRELAIQSANGIYSDADRAVLDAEAQQLVTELDRIAETTSFNGQRILDGSLGETAIHVGAEANQTISFDIPAMDTASLGFASSNGDLTGAEMSIDGSGSFSSSIAAGAIRINGQALSSINSDDNLQTLLDDINDNITDVNASSVVSVTSPGTGNGVLTGGDSVTISGVFLDGGTQTFPISNTESLDDLAIKINEKTGGIVNADLDSGGKLVLSSTAFSTMTVQDTTQGIATGINSTQIADPDIAEVIEGLTSNWIAQAENLIETHFGLKGDGVDLTLDLTYTDGVSNVAARVTALIPGGGGLGTSLTLEIDMADFTATGDESGGSSYLYMDRLLAHEMVHAVMYRNVDMLPTNMPSWFAEGAAEFIHGGDERVETDIAAGNLDDQTELSAAFATGKIGGTITATGYSASYTAVKMMHEDILAVGGTGIDEVMGYLAAGQDISTAIASVASDHGGATSWNSLASFETDFDTTGYTFMTTQLSFDGAVGTETDTGSIAGSDYFGGNDLNAETVLNNTSIGPAQDFNLIIPSEYSGGLITADAQLILTSNSGEAITVTAGAGGSENDLALFGMRTVEEAGEVLGQSLEPADQLTKLNANDLIINGVTIDSVDANTGLMAKVDAINVATSETNVVASIVAKQAFKLDDSATLEYTTAAGSISIVNNGVLGINGIGMTLNLNDTAIDIAATVNTLTEFHGATAYVDDSGKLHLQSSGTLNLGDSVAGALVTELGLTDINIGTGSIKLNGTEVSFSDITDVQTIVTDINSAAGNTGVIASIDNNGQFQLSGTSAIKISLGDTRGLQTMQRLGISFGTAGTENLTDTNNDNRIGDETFTINARIKLDSFNDQSISLSLTDNGKTATGFVDMNESIQNLAGSSISGISIATAKGAQDAIEVVDNALDTMNASRAELGAINNRLDFTVSNLTTISEKTSEARSRIMDADYAAESANLSRAQILQQASQAILAQANQNSQTALSLLR